MNKARCYRLFARAILVTMGKGICNEERFYPSSQADDGSGIMISSMTGYGRETVKDESFTVTAEIRSVNHRFMETSVFLPPSYMNVEEKLKRLVTQYIRRGKVDVYLSIEGESGYDKDLRVDWPLVAQYTDVLRQIRDRFSLGDDLKAGDLLQFGDVFTITEKPNPAEDVEEALMRAADGALQQLTQMRENEGARLLTDLQERLGKVESAVNKLIEQAPKVAQGYHSRLQERTTAFLQGRSELDEARLMNEVAVFADKANVEEELTRLKSHLQQFRNYLSAKEAVGKKLNFLQQEMNREMNTIGAKANDFDMSIEVVEAKSELESIKEQIQNIE